MFADLRGADLRQASLLHAILAESKLVCADLRRINGWDLSLHGADLTNAKLDEADLTGADLNNAKLKGASLRGAGLQFSSLVATDLTDANLDGAFVYGVGAWDIRGQPESQRDLVITPNVDQAVTVDDLEIAQFIYILLYNKKIREVIDTLTSKVVLILGRFTEKRKRVLEEIRRELRKRGYVPVLFDFKKPRSRDFIETVSTLAHIARFVVADLTTPRIVLEEVPHIVRNVTVPILPLLARGSREPITLDNLRRNHRSILPTQRYRSLSDLVSHFDEKVVAPCERRVLALS